MKQNLNSKPGDVWDEKRGWISPQDQTSHLADIRKPDLKGFASEILGIIWQYGSSFDGEDIQELALKYNLIKAVTMTEPCCDECNCAEFTEFPTTCYRKVF